MVLDEYDCNDDPDFDITRYCKENETLDPVDIINIRQAFLNAREPETDPAEMMRVRKLRMYPFFTPEDIATVAFKHRVREYRSSSDPDCRDEFAVNNQRGDAVLIGSVTD